ncbi:MAG: protein kinase domain-containing protein [Archangium sp.]
MAAEDFSTERATELVQQLARALEYAHARGVLHRDLKPANVMVQRFGSRDFVKLLDFGIARLRDDAVIRGLQVAVGSPDYLAPEQINGHKTDARTDVYALGALAWEVLVGRPPFWHHPVNAVLTAHLHAAPSSPSAHRSTVPTHVAAAVMKALAKSSEERFVTVTAFAYALTSAIANRPTPVPPLEAALRGESRHAVLSFENRRHLVVCEHTSSAGCFVACDHAAEVGTRVSVTFEGLSPISGAVVRQFDAHDARRWERQPGFFVAFRNLGTAERVALDGGNTADDVAAEAALERLRERFWGGAYAALGLGSSASQKEINFAHAQLDDALEGLARREIAPRRVSELVSAQAQLASHAHLLADLRRRADYDARRANWRGVAQCLDDGLKPEVLESLRFDFLKLNPLADLAARRHAERATHLAAQGRREEAFAAVELALCIDPLRRALHDLRASLLDRQRLAH